MITICAGNKLRVTDPFISNEKNGDDYKLNDDDNQIDYERKNEVDNITIHLILYDIYLLSLANRYLLSQSIPAALLFWSDAKYSRIGLTGSVTRSGKCLLP